MTKQKKTFVPIANITYDTDKLHELVDAAIEQARPHGEWINDGIYAEGHSERSYRCSVCDEQFIGEIGEYNFCPNCGADMRGGENVRVTY